MAKQLYTVDIIRADGSTHYTITALLDSTTEFPKVQAWLASVTALHVGATSGTITPLNANQPLPVTYDSLVRFLDQQIPMHGKPNLHPAL